jgi:hypothetical protein
MSQGLRVLVLATLLRDHLVGAREQHGRHLQAGRLRDDQVDDEIYAPWRSPPLGER